MSDAEFFDTRHEGAYVDLDANFIKAGDDVNLIERDPTLKRLIVGAGWDVNAFDSDVIDLDISVFLLDKNGKTRVDEDFVFYNNPEGSGGAIKHNGDSRTGAGDGDDETVFIDLTGLPFDIMQIMFVLSIYKGDEKRQSLDEVKGAYIRVTNEETRHELVRYVLQDDIKDTRETAVLALALTREGPKWHVQALGKAVQGGLRKAAMAYGLIVADQ